MEAHIKAITLWSFLTGACIFGGILVFSGESAHTQQFLPVRRVSTGSAGQQANEGSAGPVPSAQCECTAFISRATNLAPVGPNPIDNVFVKFESGDLVLVSAAADGGPANRPSQAQGFRPSVGGPCSCVGFSSDATNLVADDTNHVTDVFVRDIDAAVTVRASVNDAGEQANGPSSFTSLNSACSAVAFQSTADNLVPDDTNGVSDIFIRDLVAETTIRITEGPDGQANGSSIMAGMSSDGSCVVFATRATNLFPGDDNSTNRILVWCNGAGIGCRADVSTDGEPSNGLSFLPQISSDGRYVASKSEANDLVEGDHNAQPDVFRHDCQTGETILISVNSRGGQSNDINSPPSMSGDGRFVCFVSWGTNMGVPLATGGFPQV